MATWGPHPAAMALTTDEVRAGRSERDRRLLADPGRAVERTRELLAAGGEGTERFFRAGFEVAYDAYNRRDWELNTMFLDADDYIFRAGAAQEPPDFRSEYHGIEAYLEAQHALLEVWDDVRIELGAVHVRPPDQVVTTMTWRGVATRSGVPTEWRSVSDNRYRGGLAIAQTFWRDRARAERELGFGLPGPGSRR